MGTYLRPNEKGIPSLRALSDQEDCTKAGAVRSGRTARGLATRSTSVISTSGHDLAKRGGTRQHPGDRRTGRRPSQSLPRQLSGSRPRLGDTAHSACAEVGRSSWSVVTLQRRNQGCAQPDDRPGTCPRSIGMMTNRAIWSMGWALVTFMALSLVPLWPFSFTLEVGPLRAVLPGPVTLLAATAVGLMLYRGRERSRR